VLVVEDDAKLVGCIVKGFHEAGYAVGNLCGRL
jgi:hypothetical protein